LILLSLALLLFGGGFFPPLIGFVGGLTGVQIHKTLSTGECGRPLQLSASLWPWPLVIFLLWTFGQVLVGYFFNDFLQGIMGFGVILILTMMPLSVYTAYAHDRCQTRPVEAHGEPS
jgi:hypothetical protein